jgi:hypothetical protein
VRWELDATPELGDRPQAILNRQLVDECDVVVAIFWSRVGTPTGIADSGTVEEITCALEAKKPVLLYFSRRDLPSKVDLHAVGEVRALQERFRAKGICWSYSSHEDFRRDLTEHLARTLHHLHRPGDPPRPGTTDDELLVMAALAEHRADWGDHPDPWQHALSGIDLTVRTGLPPSRINDVVEVAVPKGDIAVRPFANSERNGSPFRFRRVLLTALGKRTMDASARTAQLPGRRLPLPEYVSPDYVAASGLVWFLQREGFQPIWENELFLPTRLAEGADLVETDIGGHRARLHTRDPAGDLVLLKKRLRELSREEVGDLLRRHLGYLVYVTQNGDGWTVIKDVPIPSAGGGPPVTTRHDLLAEGKTFLELLSALQIAVVEADTPKVPG